MEKRSYSYLEDIAIADVAFKAWGSTIEEMFVAAAEATMNVMVEDLDTIAGCEQRTIHVESDAEDMLLFKLLQELIYYKDAERLLLRIEDLHTQRHEGGLALDARAYGEELDPDKHVLVVGVKAVTLHRFQVQPVEKGWEATVILDI